MFHWVFFKVSTRPTRKLLGNHPIITRRRNLLNCRLPFNDLRENTKRTPASVGSRHYKADAYIDRIRAYRKFKYDPPLDIKFSMQCTLDFSVQLFPPRFMSKNNHCTYTKQCTRGKSVTQTQWNRCLGSVIKLEHEICILPTNGS